MGQNKYKSSIDVKSNRIRIDKLSHPSNVSDFYWALYKLTQKKGYQEIYIDCSSTEPVFPNACVPVAAAIQHYKKLGIDVTIEEMTPFLTITKFANPLEANHDNIRLAPDPISRIWKFTDALGVHELTTAFVDALSERIECQRGVLDGFEWCINEIMDNVLQHSQSSEGLAQIQIHPEVKNVVVCIVDTGIGIYGTLKGTEYKPRNATDAITLSLKEGVTRDKSIGQGNGLWGLSEIVSHNDGVLRITSGPGSLFHVKGNVRTFDRLPFLSHDNYGTIVDFQINTNSEIDISKALKYDHVNLRIEKMENASGELIISVRKESHGTGTRRSAEQLRNKIVNAINESNSKVILDFTGVGIVSSSFSDELIGKLVMSYGFYNFQNYIQLVGMSTTIQGIVHKAIAQRLSQGVLT